MAFLWSQMPVSFFLLHICNLCLCECGCVPSFDKAGSIPSPASLPFLQMLLLLQMDITTRVEMEKRMAALTETQLSMLEQVWEGEGGRPGEDMKGRRGEAR